MPEEEILQKKVKKFYKNKCLTFHAFLFSEWPVMLGILLTIPSTVGVLYLMVWQTEILRFEYIICAIQLTFCVAEIVTGILVLLACCQNPEYY